MRIDVWSDVVCPWCYIGKRRLEEALTNSGDTATIVWHSFQLDPSSTNDDPRDLATRIGEKYGRGPEWGLQANAHVTEIAAELGLDYHLDQAKSANTVDAHRLLHLARELVDAGQVPADTQNRLEERLFKAYFTDGLPVGDHATLTELADGGRPARPIVSVRSSRVRRTPKRSRRIRRRPWRTARTGCRSSSSTRSTASAAPSRSRCSRRRCAGRTRTASRSR